MLKTQSKHWRSEEHQNKSPKLRQNDRSSSKARHLGRGWVHTVWIISSVTSVWASTFSRCCTFDENICRMDQFLQDSKVLTGNARPVPQQHTQDSFWSWKTFTTITYLFPSSLSLSLSLGLFPRIFWSNPDVSEINNKETLLWAKVQLESLDVFFLYFLVEKEA